MWELEQELDDLIGEDNKGRVVDEGRLYFGWKPPAEKIQATGIGHL